MRAQAFGQEPGGDVEIFVVRLGEALAPGAGFLERGSVVGDAVFGRQRGPAAFSISSSVSLSTSIDI